MTDLACPIAVKTSALVVVVEQHVTDGKPRAMITAPAIAHPLTRMSLDGLPLGFVPGDLAIALLGLPLLASFIACPPGRIRAVGLFPI